MGPAGGRGHRGAVHDPSPGGSARHGGAATRLTLTSIIAGGVGLFALGFPAALLESKGVVPQEAAAVWVREVGVLLLAMAFIQFSVRRHPDSPTMKAFLLGNAALQIGLFPIEALAYRAGVITRLSGIVPNTVLHAL